MGVGTMYNAVGLSIRLKVEEHSKVAETVGASADISPVADKGKATNRYKFKELKVYSSTEWFYGNVKKYRQVFDQNEVSYLYAELTIYNKLFDEEDWETDVLIRGVNSTTGQNFCELKRHVKVSKEENIVYIREGWGNEQVGQYWRQGAYRYIAFIDGEQVAEANFHVVSKGKVTAVANPYFEIKAMRLFEGPGKLPEAKDRVYMKGFKQETARYIWVEIKVENKVPDEPSVPFEIILRFYNDTGQMKGEIAVLRFFGKGQTMMEICEGWGAEKTGTWYHDNYTIEVDCMDQLIAVVPFQVGDADIPDDGQPFVPGTSAPAEMSVPSFEEAVAELDGLIGLGTVKEQIHEFATYLKFVKLRKEKGLEESGKINLHAVFLGNPGTGKTTVARMLGKIYRSLGLLSKGHVHEVDRSALIAKYIGQTAPLVRENIDKARGGILFIDEAYALTNKGSEQDYGGEAIEILLKEMSDGPGDIAIIGAGYPAPMRDFMNANPGLRSRIGIVFDFPDYSPDELMQIAAYTAGKQGITIADDAREAMYKHVVESYRNRNEQFGNARFVNSILSEAKMNMGKRIMKAGDQAQIAEADLSTILLEDLQEVFKAHKKDYLELPVDQGLLDEAMGELGRLIGMTSVKNEIDEMVKLVRYYRDIGRDVHKAFSTNIVFTGNPGTGKTTVARILVKIYKALGILERGHLVEVDREKMVAGYIGQTAIKTAALIEQAMGGGLFIDEAYSLAKGGEGDFGHEAVETLLKRMEDQRGEFAVIAAGYPDEMERLLQSNPGLKSRFDKTINFPDYTTDELWQIAVVMFAVEELRPDSQAEGHVRSYLQYLYDNRNKYFGNARAVRKVVEEVTKKQHLRMAEIPAAQRTKEMISTVTLRDVEHLKETKENVRKTIGFKLGGEAGAAQ
jgi:SpoVK/Ycf46/Vps4 family AAA+-type ATPase